MFFRSFVLLLSLSLFPSCSDAQSAKEQEILSAIRSGANYASTILLDESGKARGDYDWITGKWNEYEPAWHTAQVIFGLVRAYQLTEDKKYLSAAKKGGDWWISLQYDSGPLNGMLKASHGSRLGDLINFTTITDGTNGIFELYRLTGDDRYAQVSKEAGDWMIDHMYIPEEGLFYNIADPVTGEIWKNKSPHHPDELNPSITQVARPNNEGYFFKDLYRYTGEARYKDIFINLCESLLKRQYDNGFWMDFEPNDLENRGGKIHPRFNIWNAESLVEAYTLTQDRRYLDAAMKTASAMADLQRKDGTIYYYNYLDGNFREGSLCGSAVSFSGILWLKLKMLAQTNEFDINIEKSLNWVLKNRFPEEHPDANLGGAFLETRTRSANGSYVISVRDIATAFGFRFLSDYLQSKG
ncbi:MAG: glycoside hydrolase family 88 protein [Cyclobacteriaceae bacterium]|nr:glycoside hydrolase family 88 protein [Cyclobacteriaceae bacterium HetDA_MAG_MS6]